MPSGVYDRKGWKGNKTSFKKGHKIRNVYRIRGIDHPNWKGGKFIRENYVFILSPNHPYKNKQGYVREHRLVMEAHLGRTLLPTEVVHHINGITTDNRIENLMLFNNLREHIRKCHNKTGIDWNNKEDIKKYRRENKEYIAKYNKDYYRRKKLVVK
jgi:hypothetical protein